MAIGADVSSGCSTCEPTSSMPTKMYAVTKTHAPMTTGCIVPSHVCMYACMRAHMHRACEAEWEEALYLLTD